MSKLIVDQFCIVADVIKIWKLQSRNMNFSDSILRRVKSSLHVSLNEYTWFLYILPANETQTLSSRDTALTPLRMLLTGFARPHPSPGYYLLPISRRFAPCVLFINDEIAARRANDRAMPLLFAMSWLGTRCTDGAWRSDSRLEASTFLQSRWYKDDERFFMVVDSYRR